MEQFAERIRNHAEHLANVAPHCDTEETTKQALILPLLEALGYSPYDPTKVKAEYKSDLPGVKRDERVDYALFSDGQPVMFIEAKACTVQLDNHAPQLARYFNATPGVCVAALTNGREWQFFTDLRHDNIMDDDPFLVVDFADVQESDFKELARFRFGHIQAESLRSFAEHLTYKSKFKEVIEECLRSPDADFVRYVASKAAPNTRLTQRTIETFTPLLKKAIAEAMSEMLVGSLNREVVAQPAEEHARKGPSDIVDPENPEIVTTVAEQQLAEVVTELLAGRIEEGELEANDTASYFSLLYRGKSNRWLLRYNVNRRQPTVQFIMGLTEDNRQEVARAGLKVGIGETIRLSRPEDLLRIAGLVYDALEYCRNDENFRRTGHQDDGAAETA